MKTCNFWDVIWKTSVTHRKEDGETHDEESSEAGVVDNVEDSDLHWNINSNQYGDCDGDSEVKW